MMPFNAKRCCALAVVVLAGCAGPDAAPGQVGRYPGDYRAPETVSLLGRPLFAEPPAHERDKLESDLRDARAGLDLDPSDPDKIIWVGRRLGYLWRMSEAIDVFTRGIERHRKYAPLYRHRGHRYLSVRQFDKAVADLETAARLMVGMEREVEPDGRPNERNIPLTTLGFNVWYHLGVAKYCNGDFGGALAAFEKVAAYHNGYDDNLVATTDWRYMCLRRLGRDEEASRLLEPITPDMDIIENRAYHRRLLMYKGLLAPEELLNPQSAGDLDWATMGYGLGNWYWYNGDRARAVRIFEKVAASPQWPAFGVIAAEAELARIRGRPKHAGP